MRFSQRRDAAGWPPLPAPLLRQGFLSRCADTPRSPSQRLRKRSIQPVPRQARPGFRLPHQTPVRPEAALSRRQLVFTVLRPVTAVERAHFRLRSDFGGSAGTTATRTLSGRHGNLTGGFRIQRRPPFFYQTSCNISSREKEAGGMPPYPEKHRGKPLRDKKDCRTKKRTAEEKESLLAGRRGNSNGTKKATGEKKRTAEEKESLLAGRGGNSNGTRKAAEGEKRTAEKRENRQVGRQSRHGPRKECKKSGRKPVSQLSKRTKTALSGTCRSGKVLLSLCRFTETVPIWPKHSIYS